MYIREAKIEDFNYIKDIYKSAREFMKNNGNGTQWGDNWPTDDVILTDIKNKKSFVCVENDEVSAVFFCEFGKVDESYIEIDGKWLSDEPYAVIHRIATNRKYRYVGEFCFNYVFEKFKHIRVDTHKNNIPMINLLNKLGFKYCGIINIDKKYCLYDTERIAYEKI